MPLAIPPRFSSVQNGPGDLQTLLDSATDPQDSPRHAFLRFPRRIPNAVGAVPTFVSCNQDSICYSYAAVVRIPLFGTSGPCSPQARRVVRLLSISNEGHDRAIAREMEILRHRAACPVSKFVPVLARAGVVVMVVVELCKRHSSRNPP